MSAAPRQSIPNPNRRRGLGGLLMGYIAIIVVASTAMFFGGIVGKYPYGFTPVPRAAYVESSNPITLALTGKPPTSSTANPLSPSPDVRAIVVEPDRIKMLAGGQLQREIKLAKPLATLQEVIATVGDPAWVANGDDKTQVLLRVALIFERHPTAMAIAAPAIKHVTMVGPPGVFIAERGSNLTFNGVTVDTRKVADAPAPFRSFVLASGGTMNAINSTFTGLGWDWNSSYGASWGDGATGSVTGCTFQQSFIGLYTAKAHNMTIADSVFRDNDLYGLDPHTGSTNLQIQRVEAVGNKAHGIIFSDNVTGSTVSDSTSHNNGENGIMMDKSSTGNIIKGNQSYDNHGDGIVMANSPKNQIISNVVRNNRVGIRVSSGDAQTTIATGNTIADNYVAVEGYPNMSAHNSIYNNGGQWKKGAFLITAVASAAAVLIWTSFYLLARAWLNRRDRRRRRSAGSNPPALDDDATGVIQR